jgi:integrase
MRARLRMLESQHDIPAKTRRTWVQDAMLHITSPKTKLMMSQAIKRLSAAGKKPKYPIVYKVDALIRRAFDQSTKPDMWPTDKLLDQLLLQLRLTTLMRSGDAANIVWALFEQDSNYFVKTTDKNGALQTYSVSGVTLETLLHYLDKYKDSPGLYLFRYAKQPECYLGPERLAKRLLQVMAEEGIDTNTFKAHSLRGATATHLLQMAPQSLVQARGRWASGETLDKYYARLHQEKDWEGLLGGHAKDRQATACAVLPPSVPQAKPTEEGESWGSKGGSTAQGVACL